jgi:hypothetical protein
VCPPPPLTPNATARVSKTVRRAPPCREEAISVALSFFLSLSLYLLLIAAGSSQEDRSLLSSCTPRPRPLRPLQALVSSWWASTSSRALPVEFRARIRRFGEVRWAPAMAPPCRHCAGGQFSPTDELETTWIKKKRRRGSASAQLAVRPSLGPIRVGTAWRKERVPSGTRLQSPLFFFLSLLFLVRRRPPRPYLHRVDLGPSPTPDTAGRRQRRPPRLYPHRTRVRQRGRFSPRMARSEAAGARGAGRRKEGATAAAASSREVSPTSPIQGFNELLKGFGLITGMSLLREETPDLCYWILRSRALRIQQQPPRLNSLSLSPQLSLLRTLSCQKNGAAWTLSWFRGTRKEATLGVHPLTREWVSLGCTLGL